MLISDIDPMRTNPMRKRNNDQMTIRTIVKWSAVKQIKSDQVICKDNRTNIIRVLMTINGTRLRQKC